MITAYIDGDWILYAAGFAGQKNKYVIPGVHGEMEFDTLTDLKASASCDRPDDWEECPVYSRVVLDPDAHYFHSAKNMIWKNCLKIAEKFGSEVEPVVLIDGDGNFRNQLATIKPYKGQRSIAAKPLKYNEIRQYLLEHHQAQVVYGQESDDQMAILQTRDAAEGFRSVIVSVDKDMLQVPGWHLNPNKGFKRISKRAGLVRLYSQCITGDSTDNIGGAYKFGPAKALPIIRECKTEKQMWEATVGCYQASLDKFGDHYNGLTPVEAATENMRLVYLRREPDELWLPPTER
jgi:hypothetical protein